MKWCYVDSMGDPDGNGPGTEAAEGGIRYLRFSVFEPFRNLTHAVFTRHGGVSGGPYRSLNLGEHVGDDPRHVAVNLDRVRRAVGVPELCACRQVHGDCVKVVETDDRLEECDALITREPDVGLLVRQADCASVILYDPVTKTAAVVHSGWRGSVQNIVGRTIQVMRKRFGCVPGNLWAAQSPSLGPCCAEYKDYRDLFPEDWERYRVEDARFDLWRVVEDQLLAAGVPRGHLESARICTRCANRHFYSYRAEGVTGRFGTVVALQRGTHNADPTHGSN